MIMTRFSWCTSRRRNAPPLSPSSQHHSSYVVQTYTHSDLRLLTSPNHFFFPSPNTRLMRLFSTPKSRFSPRRAIDCLEGLKTKKDLLSFNIYPTCLHNLLINSVLHQAAQTGSFDATAVEKRFGIHILVLGLAPELHHFLSVTAKEEMETAIIDFLVLLHHQLQSEDNGISVRRLEEDLEPSITARLLNSIGVFPDGEPPPGRRADVLEQLVQLAFLTPWKVDVWCAYLTPMQLRDVRNGITVSGDKASAKLIKDWVVYSGVLQNVAPDWGIADGLERAICEGKSTEIFSRAKVVSGLAGNVKSAFHALPKDVVERCLIPWLVRNECEALPSRRRLVAPLKCTPAGEKFLDELEAAGEDFISRIANDRDGLSLWRDWTAAHGTGIEHKEELCFSLDEKPWDGNRKDENAGKLDGIDFDSPLLSRSEVPNRENLSRGRSFIRNRRFLW